MTILSVDCGLERTGYAIFKINSKQSNQPHLLCSGLINTSKSELIQLRLLNIFNKINQIIHQYSPKIIILEQLFFFKNQKTIIPVSQAQGVILLAAAIENINVSIIPPLAIKKIITGYGLADKQAIKKMINLTLKIEKKHIGDDEYDAIAIGLAYCFINKLLLQ